MTSITRFANKRLLVAVAGACAALAAPAAITPYSMDMDTDSRSCLVDCGSYANYAIDSDTASAPSGSFANLSVASAVVDSGSAFAASAGGTTSINSDTSFTVHLTTMRPALLSTYGSYSTEAQTRFSFMTDAGGGTLGIAYTSSYARPVDGLYQDTGVGFTAPYTLSVLGGQSVPATSVDSRSGSNSGTWSYLLDPDTYYLVILGARNSRAYSSPTGFGQDSLDTTYVVTLPSFAVPVPEPTTWAMLLLGSALVTASARRRRPSQLGS